MIDFDHKKGTLHIVDFPFINFKWNTRINYEETASNKSYR